MQQLNDVAGGIIVNMIFFIRGIMNSGHKEYTFASVKTKRTNLGGLEYIFDSTEVDERSGKPSRTFSFHEIRLLEKKGVQEQLVHRSCNDDEIHRIVSSSNTYEGFAFDRKLYLAKSSDLNASPRSRDFFKTMFIEDSIALVITPYTWDGKVLHTS